MRQLLPDPIDDIDALACYAADRRDAPEGSVWLLIDMVASLDGATSVEGRSAGLSSPGDRSVFHALRAVADAIVVGAQTARSERYRLPSLPDPIAEKRVAAGRRPAPELVVVSHRLRFPDDPPFLTSDGPRAVIATATDADPARLAELSARAEVIAVGRDTVDPALLLAALAGRGHRVVVCEGGPTLNGVLLEADAVDEICLSIAPIAVSGAASRAVVGDVGRVPTRFDVARVLEQDGTLFVRYVRRGQ